jgi:DNA-binding NarL/FixJ family response regulator
MAKPRVLLADDHTLVADAFKLLLEPEFDVVGTVGDGHALLRATRELKPDIVLLDFYMPHLGGLETGPRLRAAHPNLKILVVTINDDSKVALEALRTWASGYLLKKSTGAELLRAVRDVLRGLKYVSPCLREEFAEAGSAKPLGAPVSALTPRQREVLGLLAGGHSMKEAARVLQVSTRTIAFHKYRIMREFRVKTNSDLLLFAIKEKVVLPN